MIEIGELMNIKLTLDLEIAAYDKMLVAEEELFGVKSKSSSSSPAKKTDSLAKGANKAVYYLKGNNDRFASYVDSVQRLRASNSIFEVRIKTVEENSVREITSLKGD